MSSPIENPAPTPSGRTRPVGDPLSSLRALRASGPSGPAGASFGEVLLSVKDVALDLGGQRILQDLSFEIRDRVRPGRITGQVVALLGPSGVGKTRLLRIIAGLDAPTRGLVQGPKGSTLEAGQVGVVFQNYPLLKHRTARSNLVVAGVANGLDRARAEALKLLKAPDLRAEMSRSPEAAMRVKGLLKHAGLAA